MALLEHGVNHAGVQRDPTYNVHTTPHHHAAHQYSILNFFGTKQIRNDYFLCKKSQGIFKQDYKRSWQSTTTLASDNQELFTFLNS